MYLSSLYPEQVPPAPRRVVMRWGRNFPIGATVFVGLLLLMFWWTGGALITVISLALGDARASAELPVCLPQGVFALIVFAGFCLYLNRRLGRQRRIVAQGEVTRGQVVNLRVHRMKSGTMTQIWVEFYAGPQRVVYADRSSTERVQLGDEFLVFYMFDNLDDCIIYDVAQYRLEDEMH